MQNKFRAFLRAYTPVWLFGVLILVGSMVFATSLAVGVSCYITGISPVMWVEVGKHTHRAAFCWEENVAFFRTFTEGPSELCWSVCQREVC